LLNGKSITSYKVAISLIHLLQGRNPIAVAFALRALGISAPTVSPPGTMSTSIGIVPVLCEFLPDFVVTVILKIS
jgi:hypothetical protein